METAGSLLPSRLYFYFYEVCNYVFSLFNHYPITYLLWQTLSDIKDKNKDNFRNLVSEAKKHVVRAFRHGICVEYLLLFPQKNLSPEKTETN